MNGTTSGRSPRYTARIRSRKVIVISEWQAGAGPARPGPLVEPPSRHHVIDGDAHVEGEDSLLRGLSAGFDARRQLTEIGVNPIGDAGEVHAMIFGVQKLTGVIGAELGALPHRGA